jgi:hypothetical protein
MPLPKKSRSPHHYHPFSIFDEGAFLLLVNPSMSALAMMHSSTLALNAAERAAYSLPGNAMGVAFTSEHPHEGQSFAP